MKQFITVTLQGTNTRIAVSVDSIFNVLEDTENKMTFIEQGQTKKGTAFGLCVKERFDEVLKKLEIATALNEDKKIPSSQG